MDYFTDEQRRNFANRLAAQADARSERKRKREARERLGRAMTSAERVERHRRNARDIGDIPRVRHRRVRESCKFDLVKFGVTYCGSFLNHPPSRRMIRELIRPLERIILGGGQEVIQFPRSTGKSTWTKIAILWAILYGHKRFVVCVAATGELADTMLTEIIGAFADEELAMLDKDFPGVTRPLRACEVNPKKVKSVYVNGQSSGMAWKGHRFVFPSSRTFDGKAIEPSAGAVLVSASIGGSIKGAVKKRERPDFVILDDPQNDKIADSPSLCQKAENFIDKSILGLCGQTSRYSIVMTITPMGLGDLASRYTDRELHGEWHVSTAPYVSRWPESADALLPAFRYAYRQDVEINDGTWTESTRFYVEHRDAFADVEVIDPANYAPGEMDAIHHLLVMRARMTDEAFRAEYQMDVRGESEEERLEAATVMKAVNGYAMFELPPGTRECVAFCDVNATKDAGLRYGVTAFGPQGVAAVVAYSRYPREKHRRLYPEHATEQQRKEAIIRGIIEVTREVAAMPLHFVGSDVRLRPTALCFDGGWEQDAVASTVNYLAGRGAAIEKIDLRGMQLLWSRGFGWKQYRDDDKETQFVKDHCHSSVIRKTDSQGRTFPLKFLAIHADYWREVAQKAFRAKYPAPNSVSLWGDSVTRHRQFAEEVTFEQLVKTERQQLGRRTVKAWTWRNVRKGSNHWGDVLYNSFALAHWYQLYTARRMPNYVNQPSVAATGEIIEVAPPLKKPPRRIVKKPLFRKIKRPGMR